MPLKIDEYGYELEVAINGEEIIVARSKGEKYDKISGQRIPCEMAVFYDCALVTEKRSREINTETGKRGDEYLQIIYDAPLYTASEFDNSAEDRVEYPAGSDIIYRITDVDRQGHSLCRARAVRVNQQKDCDVSQPAENGIGVDFIGFERDRQQGT